MESADEALKEWCLLHLGFLLLHFPVLSFLGFASLHHLTQLLSLVVRFFSRRSINILIIVISNFLPYNANTCVLSEADSD